MSRAIVYRKFGGLDVLEMADVPDPTPGRGEVRVAVRAVGLNPVDAKSVDAPLPLRVGEHARILRDPARWFGRGGARFPRIVGRDFAGIVDAVGDGVPGVAVGDAVLGTLRSVPGDGSTRGSLTEKLLAPVTDFVAKPDSLGLDVAGCLGVAAQTACGALRRLDVAAADTLVVSGASGGVGSLAVQLAVLRGATVIGIAGPRNADYLRSLGAIPVPYGDGLGDRIRAAAAQPLTKFLDCHGGGYVQLALDLGLSPRTVGTLVPVPVAIARGVRFTGARDAEPGDLYGVATRVAAGTLAVTIAGVYPFDVAAVRQAYGDLLGGHVRGKLVVSLP